MAFRTINVTVGQQFPSGAFLAMPSIVSDVSGAASTADTNIATVQTNLATLATNATAVNSAVTAALANGTISGDPTALGLVTAIQTAMTTLGTTLTTTTTNAATAKGNTATAKAGTSANVSCAFDAVVITSVGKLRSALNAVICAAKGSGLSE